MVCPNHPGIEMVRQDGFFALTKVQKNGANITFLPASGVPVIVYLCRVCGKIEAIAAIADDLWNKS